jgi:hypothetical protein
MRLTELQPKLFTLGWSTVDSGSILELVTDLSQADGLEFQCPKCFKHSCFSVKPTVPDSALPDQGRRNMTGFGLDDLTLDTSVQVRGGCAAHFTVSNGEVTLL